MIIRLPLKNFIINLTILGIFLPKYIELIFILLSSVTIISKTNLKYAPSLKLYKAFLLVLLISVVSIITLNYHLSKLSQQFFLLITFFICYSFIFNFLKDDIENLFNKYIKMAFFISILGIIQFLVYFLTRIDIFYFTSDSVNEYFQNIIRISSILFEPAYLAGILLPALVYYIYSKPLNRIYYKKYYFVIILVAFLLTYSSIGYLILIIALLWRIINFRNKLIKLFFVFCLSSILMLPTLRMNNLQSKENRFSMMVIETFSGLKNISPENFEKNNLSTYAIVSNIYVALNAPSRIIGTGLGTHEQNYSRVYISDFQYHGLNSKEAYSLFTRIFSEFGFVGLLTLFFFLIKYYNKHNLINTSAFFLIILLLLRGGHYTIYGVIFFFFLYYYTGRESFNSKIMK